MNTAYYLTNPHSLSTATKSLFISALNISVSCFITSLLLSYIFCLLTFTAPRLVLRFQTTHPNPHPPLLTYYALEENMTVWFLDPLDARNNNAASAHGIMSAYFFAIVTSILLRRGTLWSCALLVCFFW
jgi:hypothetical protein